MYNIAKRDYRRGVEADEKSGGSGAESSFIPAGV